MATRSPQTMAKRAREMAVKEKRELKRLKKEAAAAERRRVADGGEPLPPPPEEE